MKILIVEKMYIINHLLEIFFRGSYPLVLKMRYDVWSKNYILKTLLHRIFHFTAFTNISLTLSFSLRIATYRDLLRFSQKEEKHVGPTNRDSAVIATNRRVSSIRM